MQVLCPHCQGAIELIDLPTREMICPSCGSSFQLQHSTTDWRSRSGERKLGKFTILSELGVGAFGTVHKARDTELDRIVAVKVPRTGDLSSQEDQDRILREARSAAQLRHPNIVPLYEVGQAEGVPYLVSAYVQGVTLADLMTARRPPVREAAELVAAVANALQYAHEQGVIHRDVKPSNIMIGNEGTPYLMDFGLAKREAGEVTMTVEGQVLGTPAYMSPEQARGEAHRVDGRSDVYSLGVILYRLLTGELPFRGNPRMLLHQVLHDEPRSPRSLNDRIPLDLETICLRALAKEPGRRYQSARAFGEDLCRFLKGEPIQARPVSRWERGWTWAKRKPAQAALLAVSGLVILALGAGAVGLAYHERLQEEFGKTQIAKEAAERAYAKAEVYRYFYQVGLAGTASEKGNMARVEQLLEDCPVERRGWEWHYLKRRCHADILTLHGLGTIHGLAFSPDGKRLASISFAQAVQVWDVTTGKEVLHCPCNTGTESVAFSPDGKWLACPTQDGNVIIWDATTGRQDHIIRANTGPLLRVAFSADWTRFASVGFDGSVRIWDVATGRETCQLLHGNPSWLKRVAISADGTRVAACFADGLVKIWDATNGQEIINRQGHLVALDLTFSPEGSRLVSCGSGPALKVWDARTGQESFSLGREGLEEIGKLAYSPDGTRLAAGRPDDTIQVYDTATYEIVDAIRGNTATIDSLVYSPDGTRLASAARGGTVKIWNTHSNQNALTITSPIAGSLIPTVAFSSDGRYVASARDQQSIQVLDVMTGKAVLELAGHSDRVRSVAFSPDGRRLASASIDRTAKLWDANTGRQLHTFSSDGSEISSVAFSPDSKYLACTGGLWEKPDRPGEVSIWDTTTFHRSLTLKGHRGAVWGLAFSPDGQRLASASEDGTIRLWDLTTGREAIPPFLGHTSRVISVAFSPDGTVLASSSWDNTIRFWDATSGRELRRLEGHGDVVNHISFSPDGKRLATASADQTVRIWDVEFGMEVLTLRGHPFYVFGVSFSPDGTRIASIDGLGILKIWDGRPWTSEATSEIEALGLLKLLFSKPLAKADVLDYLRTSATITAPARQLALSLVGRYCEETNPEKYRQASWTIVRQPYLNAFQYHFALSQAETACRFAPGGKYRTTLGAAQYRTGQYLQARTTLMQAEFLYHTTMASLALLAPQFPQAFFTLCQALPLRQTVPANLAFLAMTHHRLGQKELAQVTLARLRNILEKPEWAMDEEVQKLLREGEALVGAKPPSPQGGGWARRPP